MAVLWPPDCDPASAYGLTIGAGRGHWAPIPEQASNLKQLSAPWAQTQPSPHIAEEAVYNRAGRSAGLFGWV